MINREVPTLAYVWTSGRLPVGAVVASPHHPRSVRSIVVRSGVEQLGHWMRERRNVLAERLAAGAGTKVHYLAPDAVDWMYRHAESVIYPSRDATRRPEGGERRA